MKTVELVKGIHSSVLGFGCAPVLGAIDAKTARYAIDLALEHGINHFDLARSYGYGRAEAFVGNILKGHRDKMVLASKFGIKANWKADVMRPVKPLVRALRKAGKSTVGEAIKPNTNSINMVADHFHDRIPLRGKEMQKSLERSLKELKTDYIDYFFVHEPHEVLHHIDELMELAEKLKQEGKIRAFGLAFMRSQEHMHKSYLERFDLLQFNASPGAEGYDSLAANRQTCPNVIFSPIRGGSAELSPAEKISGLITDFPNSVVLCSMFSEAHLKQNVKLIL